MTLATRRIIMFGFIAAFFIIAPILLFYTSGYRLDLKRYKILKTGTLMLEAKDIKQANLYIDDQLYEEPFDEKIFVYNLLPGEYDVRLEKQGYHPWEKKITINSSLTTFAKNIILFKDNIPLQIIDGNIKQFYLSPDYNKMVYLTNTEKFLEFYIYDLNTKESELIYRLPPQETAIKINWAASSKKILLQHQKNYLVFDINNLKDPKNINDLINIKINNIIWDLNSDNIVYVNNERSIYKIDLLAAKQELIFTNSEFNINNNFFIEANDIFYIQAEENQNVLYKYNLSFQTNKTIIELNKSDNYTFIKSTNNYLAVIDQDIEKLYLIQKVINEFSIDISDEPVKEFNATDATWDTDEKELLIYNDFEIQQFSTATKKTEFINRYGQMIKNVIWYPNLSYILILFDNKIEIVDLVLTNGVRNFTTIVKFDQLYDLYLDKKGDNLYFNGSIGKQQGIYQLELK